MRRSTWGMGRWGAWPGAWPSPGMIGGGGAGIEGGGDSASELAK